MTKKIRTSIQSVYEKLWEVLALYEKTDGYNTVPAGEKVQDISEYMGNKLMKIRQKIQDSFSEYPQIGAQLMQIVDETEYFVRCYEIPGVVKRWQEINPKILFFDCAFDLMEKYPKLYRKICSGFTFSKLMIYYCGNSVIIFKFLFKFFPKLACYPDRAMKDARKKYFQDAKKKYETTVSYTDLCSIASSACDMHEQGKYESKTFIYRFVQYRRCDLRYAWQGKYESGDISDIEDRAFQDELLRTLALVFKNDFRIRIEGGNAG